MHKLVYSREHAKASSQLQLGLMTVRAVQQPWKRHVFSLVWRNVASGRDQSTWGESKWFPTVQWLINGRGNDRSLARQSADRRLAHAMYHPFTIDKHASFPFQTAFHHTMNMRPNWVTFLSKQCHYLVLLWSHIDPFQNTNLWLLKHERCCTKHCYLV
jgi:hypothetical protein